MQSLTWRILNSNSVVTEIKHSLIPCRIIWIWLNNIWVTHCVCRSESRIISEIDPLCFQVKSSHVQSFLKNALTAQLIQQQDDKGETPSVFSASSCGCSGVFWPRRALLSRIVVCAHCVPPERQNVAMSRKNHTHFFQQRDGVDEMFTHQTKLRCYGAAVAAEQRRSLCEWNTAVRACVRACSGGNSDAVKWTTLPRFSVPPAVMVMPPTPPLEPKFAWTSVYSELISSSSSNADGALMYSPSGLKELNSVFRWKSWMKICCFCYAILLEKTPVVSLTNL